jgi:outer membrane protein assembly factor BamE (lipoprotein component of BamABCDE complex)
MIKTLFAIAAWPLMMGSAVPGYFPKMGDGWTDHYIDMAAQTARQLVEGMTREQVYHLLGEPHYNEGIGAKTWNYSFALHHSKATAPVNCDLQLLYKQGRIVRIHWKTEDCAKIAATE